MNNVGQNSIRQITTAYLALQSSSHAKKNSNFLGKTGTRIFEHKAKNTHSELRLLDEFLLM